MVVCSICGERLYLPRKCSYCNQYFCDRHRLPENHNCLGLPERKWENNIEIEQPNLNPLSSPPTQIQEKSRSPSFSKVFIQLVMIFGVSLVTSAMILATLGVIELGNLIDQILSLFQ